MALTAGDRLGPYEVISLIGVGGMGRVYSAHDPRTGRDVAIKVSDERFSERFDSEVRAVAALNHPNICTLFDVGPNYLVMELVEGPTLSERIGQGAVPLEEALVISRQIAEALEAAHEKGIVHRDLKPGNVKIKSDNMVKVLDFGLAKTTGMSAAVHDASATSIIGNTGPGMILGTPAYMAPEQARGKPVDKRADIWAFGVILYEMLTGRRLFGGETLSDTLAQVLEQEPNWDPVPPRAQPLLRRCLVKDPRRRLRDIGDAMPLLEAEVWAERPERPHSWTATASASVLAIALMALAVLHFREPPPLQPEPVRFQIPSKLTMGVASPFSISPNGRKLVLAAAGSDGTTRLWIRSLDSLELRPLAGTETHHDIAPPFWSPDSHYIAFDAVGSLKRVDVAGGPPQTICPTSTSVVGGAWNRDDTIIFALHPGGIMQVAAAGGTPLPLTAIDVSRKESAHVFPSFLPDGRHFIYLTLSRVSESLGVYVGSLDAKPSEQARRRVVATALGPAYVPPLNAASGVGHLLFRRERSLISQPFDDRTQELSGEPVEIAEGLSSFLANGFFSASANGVLVHRAGGDWNSQLTWFDRQGRAVGVVGDPGYYSTLALSPDNKQAVFSRMDYQTLSQDLWLLDVSKGTSTRFTFGLGLASNPVWSWDGSRIVYTAIRNGQTNLYEKFASGVKGEEALLNAAGAARFPLPTSWSADRRFLMYTAADARTGSDIWVLALGSRKTFPVLHSEFSESSGQFSPDMRWVAYVSNESGREEVYVRAFSPDNPEGTPPGQWLVSKGGGTAPRWGRGGKELTYVRADGKLIAVGTSTGPAFQAGSPAELFQLASGGGPVDVAADGLVLQAIPLEKDAQAVLTVVLNWQAGLKK